MSIKQLSQNVRHGSVLTEKTCRSVYPIEKSVPLWADTPIEETISRRHLPPAIMNKTTGLDIVVRGILDANLIINNMKCCRDGLNWRNNITRKKQIMKTLTTK